MSAALARRAGWLARRRRAAGAGRADSAAAGSCMAWPPCRARRPPAAPPCAWG
ncbi:hypothetical protein LP419_38940 [Massilia sp. H-1]|nr:hypothetical protein LP419_38940 [Massilia sp. H-1]